MIIEGRVQTTDLAAGEGAPQTLRMTKNAAIFVADAHGRYYDACRRGNLYSYNQTTVGALSVASATGTGLMVWNASTSAKAIAVLDLVVSLSTLPAAQFALGLFGSIQPNIPTSQTLTGVTIQPLAFGKGSSASSVGQVSSASTIITPVLLRTVSGGGAATEASQITPVFIRDEIAGQIMMFPGTLLSLQAITTAVSTLATIVGEEVPAV